METGRVDKILIGNTQYLATETSCDFVTFDTVLRLNSILGYAEPFRLTPALEGLSSDANLIEACTIVSRPAPTASQPQADAGLSPGSAQRIEYIQVDCRLPCLSEKLRALICDAADSPGEFLSIQATKISYLYSSCYRIESADKPALCKVAAFLTSATVLLAHPRHSYEYPLSVHVHCAAPPSTDAA